jgi:hypothetical protein
MTLMNEKTLHMRIYSFLYFPKLGITESCSGEAERLRPKVSLLDLSY